MGMWIGRNRKARVTYGFDEIALVPGRVTINPNEVDITFRLPRKTAEPLELKIPILASAMDGVVDVGFAIAMNKLGGLAVLNLEGVQTRYKNPQEVLQKIVEADRSDITGLLQRIYQEPVQEDLIAARVRQIKDGGALAAVSSIPQRAAEFGRIAQEAGADVFVVQSTVSTVRHISSEYKSLDLEKFCREMRIPVIVVNTVGYDVTFEIMEAEVAGDGKTGRYRDADGGHLGEPRPFAAEHVLHGRGAVGPALAEEVDQRLGIRPAHAMVGMSGMSCRSWTSWSGVLVGYLPEKQA